MIQYVSPEREPLFWERLPQQGLFGTKLYSLAQTYGVQDPNHRVNFWLMEEGGVLGRQGRTLTIAAKQQIDPDELVQMLLLQKSDTIEGAPQILQELERWLGGSLTISWMLESRDPFLAGEADGTIERADSLTPVYQLLCSADASFAEKVPYEGWLVENSYKQRHGLADIWILKVENKIISTIGIYEKDRQNAIIASGATSPEGRGSGAFRRLLAYAVKQAKAQGLRPCLVAKEEDLMQFYKRQGFVEIGHWGSWLADA
ncbi:MAG: GNAT family N-acetyltransferase [Anaerotruncus sp.]|nr:GNAT family N-acetyltransferase [Anaerotruncus sp.]